MITINSLFLVSFLHDLFLLLKSIAWWELSLTFPLKWQRGLKNKVIMKLFIRFEFICCSVSIDSSSATTGKWLKSLFSLSHFWYFSSIKIKNLFCLQIVSHSPWDLLKKLPCHREFIINWISPSPNPTELFKLLWYSIDGVTHRCSRPSSMIFLSIKNEGVYMKWIFSIVDRSLDVLNMTKII